MALDAPQDLEKGTLTASAATADGDIKRIKPHFFQDYWQNAKERPLFMLLPPLLVFCVLCTLSIVGVVLGANKYEADARARAASAALDWAATFRLSTEKIFTPLVTLSILIQQNPQVAAIDSSFPTVARQLLDSVNKEREVVQELQVTPMGIIQMIYPENNNTRARLGINVFNQSALRGGAIKTVEARDIIVNGPLKLVQGNFGTIGRIPIFIQNSTLNETFGTNRTLPYNCTELCFNASTGEKFWGFATAIGPLDDLRSGNDTRLDLLKSKGYNWLMTRPYTATERADAKLYRPEWTDRYDQYVFANSSVWPSQSAVARDIHIGNAVWWVYLEPEGGWRPHWERGVIAAVVLGNVLMAVLVGIIVAGWAQQQRLLDDVLVSNAQLADTTSKLQEEKLRLDALLVRQYNLLAVLGGNRARGRGANGQPLNSHDTNSGSPEHSSMGSKEGLTLERIEIMRRQLAVNSNTSLQDLESIQTMDLLGEGTFGKVYKGLWRGTTVAVKTMLLPSNMSGAEKREKMAVMEAAISSSLSHPNVVQTYTYAIRPMRDVSANLSSSDGSDGARMEANIATRVLRPADPGYSGSIHSYEVRLVLEFCDKGCLRDALDDGAFLLADGLVNYLAILETAADVAKAMVHLHSLNVLHSDLKARNVMLSSGNTDERGIVGKVGDFGLSLKMDHMETHISQVYAGTMSHMAPEIMLEGRVSKAADVYAFGITMWELYTALRAFDGVPRALLGHAITREQLRPKFPDDTPSGYRELAERCWLPSWEQRPTFNEILHELLALRYADTRRTPAVKVVPRQYMRPLPPLPPAPPSAGGSGSSPSGSAAPQSSNQAALPLPQLLRGTSLGSGGVYNTVSERSVYLEASLDASEVLMVTDWSHGASGMSTSARSLLQRSRPLVMPKISEAGEIPQQQSPEAPADEPEQQQEQQQQEQQQQEQQQQEQQQPTHASGFVSERQQQAEGSSEYQAEQQLQQLEEQLEEQQQQLRQQQQQLRQQQQQLRQQQQQQQQRHKSSPMKPAGQPLRQPPQEPGAGGAAAAHEQPPAYVLLDLESGTEHRLGS